MKAALSILAVILLCGCQPRGESRSLDEILTSEKDRFASLSAEVKLAPEIAQTVDSVKGALEDLATPWNGAKVAKEAETVADGLTALIGHAGFTSRAAFDELTREYRTLTMLQTNDNVRSESARIRLLVARTYGLLSGELSSRGFTL